jgi:hypothetical protein
MLSAHGNECYGESICPVSSSIQMTLAFNTGYSKCANTVVSTLRQLAAFACPEVVRQVLSDCPDMYDSKVLCYMVARIASGDRFSYISPWYEPDSQPETTLHLDDLRALLHRRTTSNQHKDWEATAVVLAARANRADILRMIIEAWPEVLGCSGMAP